jgi:NadR type nicotinamide-nucleotide adenylyltransferase
MIKICLFGPESTGKSTLARNLAAHYDAPFVAEYAQNYIEARGGELQFKDLDIILKEQLYREDAYKEGRLLFCDSDALTTSIWSNYLYGKVSSYVETQSLQSAARYTHTLLLNIDVPWVDDVHRYAPEKRQDFFDICEAALKEQGRAYTIISGNWQERFEKSCKVIDNLMQV